MLHTKSAFIYWTHQLPSKYKRSWVKVKGQKCKNLIFFYLNAGYYFLTVPLVWDTLKIAKVIGLLKGQIASI